MAETPDLFAPRRADEIIDARSRAAAPAGPYRPPEYVCETCGDEGSFGFHSQWWCRACLPANYWTL